MILNGQQESSSQPEKFNPNPQPQQSGGGGVESTSSKISEINELLNSVESLLNNDFIQNRLTQKMKQKQGGHRQPQRQPVQYPSPQTNINQGNTPTQTDEKSPEKQVNYNKFDLREYFSHKIITESGRKKLSKELDKLTEYIDGDSSINQIKKELVSEEFEEKIKNLQQAGILPEENEVNKNEENN